MSTILVTGFDAFGSLTSNPSEELVRALATLPHPASVQVLQAILPTSYARAWPSLQAALEMTKPDVVLMFGYSSRVSGALRLEPVAANRDNATSADNDGEKRHGVIDGEEPRQLVARVSVLSLAAAMRHQGHQIEIAARPTGYVCNHAYYQLLALLAAENRDTPALLIHVPGPDLHPSSVTAARDLIARLAGRSSASLSQG